MIVSTPRNFENDALAELDFLMHQLFPENKFNYGKTIVKGLIWGNLLEVDPIQAIHQIKEFVESKPFKLQYLLKFVPIQKVLITDFDVIEEYLLGELDQIGPDESFKILINKRRIHQEKMEIITKLARNITRTVNLDNPDKIIRLEIIGKYTGISILKNGDVYSAGRKVL